MDVKAVTLAEASTLDQFLTEISFSAPGTMDAQYETLSRLISFRSKVRQAIEEETNDQTSRPRPGE